MQEIRFRRRVVKSSEGVSGQESPTVYSVPVPRDRQMLFTRHLATLQTRVKNTPSHAHDN